MPGEASVAFLDLPIYSLFTLYYINNGIVTITLDTLYIAQNSSRLYKPVSDWIEMLPLDCTGLNM